MRPKGMEDLAAFSAREVKKTAAEERERDKYSSAKGQWESNKKQSHPSKLLKIEGRGTFVGAIDRRGGTDRRNGRWSEPRS